MAPKNATTGAQNCYSPLCPPASKHTTDGPQESEYSGSTGLRARVYEVAGVCSHLWGRAKS